METNELPFELADNVDKEDYRVLFYFSAMLMAFHYRDQKEQLRRLTEFEDFMVQDLKFTGLDIGALHRQFEHIGKYLRRGYGGQIPDLDTP